ncbi:hypothetical protein [Nereida sp. MMG025]|uniref:hypothetical protein n=1 Tax=Nereida sp. MMG025 TaxID=2909981 RepID=UPI001F3A4565|nr:hypothetical protein [Nereida sp. MMG025]MCF6445068.1 hypothetical protein [Nereida sp. MMG025]
MSDPVSNVDIEDVLSSIRRLVSDEHRETAPDEHEDTAASAEGSQPEEIAPDPEGARLLLTPALRVDLEQTTDQPTELSAANDDGDTGVADDRSDMVDTMAEQTDGSDEPYEAPEGDSFEIDPDKDQIMEWSDITEDDNVVAFFANSPTVAAEAQAPAQDTDYEEDAEVAVDAQAASEKPSVSDVLIEESQVQDEIEADLEEDAENAFDADDDSDADFEDDSLFEEAVLDEDALRQVVSQIVREELQGALGERITRNVRKLVRREIQRALVSKDLE